MRQAVAVLESDVHYTLQTMKEADAATRQAIDLANKLQVPLVIGGDLHDTKANMRGECMNCMLETFRYGARCGVDILLDIGNHDKINEKGEEHSLGFLAPYCEIFDSPRFTNKICVNGRSVWIMPYMHSTSQLRAILRVIDAGSTVIIHQGLKESDQTNMIDPTAITLEDVAGLRIISGHYHSREQIEYPNGTTWDFIGNPYTLSFGEAHDPEKGIQILYDDGSLEFVPTKLRKHVIIEYMPATQGLTARENNGDLLWIKAHGTLEELSQVTRSSVKAQLGVDTFKLDLIPTQTATLCSPERGLSTTERFDGIVDTLDASPDRKEKLKTLWRELLS